MNNDPTTTYHLLILLAGTWTGEGRGGYPTVTSFAYRETLSFTRRDEKTLAYEQRTQKRYDGQTEWLESHWENGFIRILDNGEMELTNAQIGRVEVLTGKVETEGNITRVNFMSKTIANDPRIVSSARKFELDGDTLRYAMDMQTTKVEQSTQHLKIELFRIK